MNRDLQKLKELVEDLAGMFGAFPDPAIAFVGFNKDKKYKKEKAAVNHEKPQEK